MRGTRVRNPTSNAIQLLNLSVTVLAVGNPEIVPPSSALKFPPLHKLFRRAKSSDVYIPLATIATVGPSSASDPGLHRTSQPESVGTTCPNGPELRDTNLKYKVSSSQVLEGVKALFALPELTMKCIRGTLGLDPPANPLSTPNREEPEWLRAERNLAADHPLNLEGSENAVLSMDCDSDSDNESSEEDAALLPKHSSEDAEASLRSSLILNPSSLLTICDTSSGSAVNAEVRRKRSYYYEDIVRKEFTEDDLENFVDSFAPKERILRNYSFLMNLPLWLSSVRNTPRENMRTWLDLVKKGAGESSIEKKLMVEESNASANSYEPTSSAEIASTCTELFEMGLIEGLSHEQILFSDPVVYLEIARYVEYVLCTLAQTSRFQLYDDHDMLVNLMISISSVEFEVIYNLTGQRIGANQKSNILLQCDSIETKLRKIRENPNAYQPIHIGFLRTAGRLLPNWLCQFKLLDILEDLCSMCLEDNGFQKLREDISSNDFKDSKTAFFRPKTLMLPPASPATGLRTVRKSLKRETTQAAADESSQTSGNEAAKTQTETFASTLPVFPEAASKISRGILERGLIDCSLLHNSHFSFYEFFMQALNSDAPTLQHLAKLYEIIRSPGNTNTCVSSELILQTLNKWPRLTPHTLSE